MFKIVPKFSKSLIPADRMTLLCALLRLLHIFLTAPIIKLLALS